MVRLYLVYRLLSDPILKVIPPWCRVLFPLISRLLSMLCSVLGMEGGGGGRPSPQLLDAPPRGGLDLNQTPADVGIGFDLNEPPVVGEASSSSPAPPL